MNWWFWGIISATVAVDLITKLTIPGILNPGISWGLGAKWPWLWLVIVALSVVVVGLLIWWFYHTPKTQRQLLFTVGLALFIGGVLGNAIDRCITNGAVHDFIDFVIFKNNLADIAITIGAVLIGVKFALR